MMVFYRRRTHYSPYADWAWRETGRLLVQYLIFLACVGYLVDRLLQ